MSRKNKLKMNRVKYNLKRYVFSGRYFVRNALFVMIIATIISIGVVGYSLLTSSSDADDIDAAAEQGSYTDSRLVVAGPSMIESIDQKKLGQVIDEEQKVEMTAKKDSVLTYTRYDMTGKFLCIIDTVNIRSEASEQADVAGCLYRGATGKVLEAGDTWTKIQSGSVTGYVANDLILTDAEATEKAEEYQGYMATAKQGNVCVRLEAAEDGEILYLTLSGEKFIACDKESSNGWYNVRLADGTYGYISADYVTVEEDTIDAVSIEKIDETKTVMKQIAERAAEEAAKIEAEEEKAEADEADTNESEGTETEDRRKKVEEREKQLEQSKAELKKAEEEAAKQEAEAEKKKEEEKAADNSTTQTTTQEQPVEADTSDLYLLAAITYCEAGSEPYEGQLAVANVVLNRLRNGGYGKTLADVIYAPYQFTGCKMWSFQGALKTGGSASCLKAAQEALNGVNNIGSCKYFRPYKNLNLDKIGNYTIIGTHAFY